MLRPLLVSAAVAAGLALTTRPAAAQMHHEMAEPPAGSCDLCAPQLFIDGAALFRPDALLPDAASQKTVALVRARLEVGSFVPHVGLFTQMEFTPADGPTPAIQFGLALWAMRRQSPLNLSAGLGVTDYREGIGEARPGAFVAHGYGQVRLQYRTPVHDVTLYAQAGAPLISGGRATYQLGASHPLAPYKLHLP